MAKFETICSVAGALEDEHRRKVEAKLATWDDSPFLWLARTASGTKGAVGRQLAANVCKADGFNVANAKGGKENDVAFLLNGRAVAVKTAMLGENGLYMFEQIRNRDYEILFLLGLSPKDAHSWVFLKRRCLPCLEHQGDREKEKWIHVIPGKPPKWISPKSPPKWMRDQTGNLGELMENLNQILAR